MCDKKSSRIVHKDFHDQAIGMKDREIKTLKKIIKAQARMIKTYVDGKPSVPEWVFATIDKGRKKYGDDLTKII